MHKKKEAAGGTFLLWLGSGDAYRTKSGLQISLVSSLDLPPASCITNRLTFLALRVFIYTVGRLPPYRALAFKLWWTRLGVEDSPVLAYFLCFIKHNFGNKVFFRLTSLDCSSSLWRYKGRNFKGLATSYPQREMNACMFPCLLTFFLLACLRQAQFLHSHIV